jgi:uncharacterized membrane protein YfcA
MLEPGILSSPHIGHAVLIGVVFLIAGMVKGIVGLGLPTVSMALLALLMTPAEAAALLIFPSLVTNAWQMRPFSSAWPLLRRLGTMKLGVCASTLLGAWALGAPAGAWAVVALGVALITYAVWSLLGAQLHVAPADEGKIGPIVGAATGLITAATGVYMIPAVPYLQAIGLQRDQLIQAMGISFTISTLALALGLYLNGRYTVESAGLSVFMLLPVVGGMAIGQLLRGKLSPVRFRQFFMGSILALGLHMIVRELT